MKAINFIMLLLALSLISCSVTKNISKPKLLDNYTFLITETSTDPSYGFTEKNPIKVGGVDKSEGPLNEKRFLNALAGPNGERIYYNRAGSCCNFKTKNGFMGVGLLDIYKITMDGSKDTSVIYINMYDYGVLKAPVGFTIKGK